MLLTDFAFTHSFRVRWSEIDRQGVVFNARYLDYADVAITEYWRASRWREAMPDEAFEFHVVRAAVTFRKPIGPDEMITVAARTAAIGRTSMTQLIGIFGHGGSGDIRADVEMVSVHVDLATHRPIPLPAGLAAIFAGFDTKKPT